jgi:polyphosphate kinase
MLNESDVVSAVIDLRDPALYTNRELSWLDFFGRVLALAENETVPLLERCRFLAICAGILDEFFMVRVAAIQEAAAAKRRPSTPDAMPRDDVVEAVTARIRELILEQSRIWAEHVRPRLAAEDILVSDIADLHSDQRRRVAEIYDRQVAPTLTPLAVGPGLPFPYISGLSLNLGLIVRNPQTREQRFARVKVPPGLPRLFAIDDHLVPLEQLIETHIDRLFPGMEVVECLQFRVTRDADFDISEDADDLLGAVEDQLRQRRFGDVVRLEVHEDAPSAVLEELTRALEVGPGETYPVPGLLDMTCLFTITRLDRPELKDAPWEPVVPVCLRPIDADDPVDLFEVIRSGDMVVHHPYDSFDDTVERFVVNAVDDPNVLAIKQTMYRTSGDTPIVPALIRAAEAGIQTVCLVEVKARFDEERNIRWARAMERAGVHVVYGIPGLKTHGKLCLVVRQDGDAVRRYVHIGTGNYNPSTARHYTDVGLFTCDDDITSDVANLFNYLTGFGQPPEYKKILVAPRHLREGLIAEIDRVAEAHRAGTPGHIVMKLNACIDGPVIVAIYRASQAGVQIDLIVRSICGLRPGVPGVSDNVRVTSIVGRYLEHARIFAFHSGDSTRMFIGSADMMVRNLDHRVEVVTPVEDPGCQQQLLGWLDVMLADTGLAWELRTDGTWEHRRPAAGEEPVNSQDALMAHARAGSPA